jgi:hypothetical protein
VGLRMLVDVASAGSRSSKAECGPLIVPGKRQTWVLQQLRGPQITRLAPFEDRLGDVRGEIAEADYPSEIGSAHPFAQSQQRRRPGPVSR